MELENIVANTVLLKAREGTCCFNLYFFYLLHALFTPILYPQAIVLDWIVRLTICDAKIIIMSGCLGGPDDTLQHTVVQSYRCIL